MKWQTPVELPKPVDFIRHTHQLVSVGSCFSENIGNYLNRDGFEITINPYGILFHPLAIVKAVDDTLNGKISEGGFIQRNDYWLHFNYHSSIVAPSKAELYSKIETIQKSVINRLTTASHLLLTFGTAWGFIHQETEELVANCHKVDQSAFRKTLTTPQIIEKRYKDLFQQLKALNPTLEIVLTVSPVRHLKNGAHGNNISKATLLLAVNKLVEKFNFVRYFPSYEIIMDELRDYRFFNTDMMHPTEQATDYVYEKFESVYFSNLTKEIALRYRKIKKLRAHKSLQATNPILQQKVDALQAEIERLKLKL